MTFKSVLLSALFMSSLPAFAAPNYVAPMETEVTRRSGKTVALAGNKCVVCHGPAGPPMNSFGTDMQAVSGNLGYGSGGGASWVNGLPGGVTVSQAFQNLVDGLATVDSDIDTHSNETELGAGSNPGDSSSIPGATSDTGGGGGGDTQILSPRNQENNNSSISKSTLSGCGQVADLDQPTANFSRADFGRVGLYALFLFLPLALLSFLRSPKVKPVPVEKTGSAPRRRQK